MPDPNKPPPEAPPGLTAADAKHLINLPRHLSNLRVAGLESELATTQANLSDLTIQVRDLKNALIVKTVRVAQLERLCKRAGLDYCEAPPAAAQSPGEMTTAEEWAKRAAAVQTPEELTAVVEAYAAALDRGEVVLK